MVADKSKENMLDYLALANNFIKEGRENGNILIYW